MESRLRGLGGDYSGESREGTMGTTSGNTADARCARRREEWDAQKDRADATSSGACMVVRPLPQRVHAVTPYRMTKPGPSLSHSAVLSLSSVHPALLEFEGG